MNITIINDCKDENAKGRQLARIGSIFQSTANFIGVSNELEAAGNIIDVLDANGDNDGIILVNVAPRNGKAKKHKNGTPFGYFWYKKTLVVSSIDGFTLSLVKKLKLTKCINLLDIPEALDVLIKDKFLTPGLKNHIVDTQFRSYDFLPRIAFYTFTKKSIKSNKIEIETIPNAPMAIWWVDNFGNCKTTLLSGEAEKIKNLEYYPRLKDVPDKKSALVAGSSGLGDKRFLEIVVQGGSVAGYFKLFSEQELDTTALL
ncbi:MAG: hypothetical protein Q7S10_01095 [bacterium]|nr:hypothetical protein [bacterium]